MKPPFCLFDDARPGAGTKALLFEAPHEVVIAERIEEVLPALEAVRAGLAAGHHAAGYLAYEAGYALDPALEEHARLPDGPLVWFGLFDAPKRIDVATLPCGEARVTEPRPCISRADYLAAAQEVREALFAGDYYQANLTFGCDLMAGGDALSLYALVRERAAAPWGGVISTGERDLISFSPEQFFYLENNCLEAKPMKGTAPRGDTPEVDKALKSALSSDEKQRAENLMIVDLLRNDLARVAEAGSVEVPDLFAVETYPTVHQMVSRVGARLAPGLDAVDVLKTIFPCGSVTGAPKIAAMQALRRLEPEARGAYTGSMGWIAPPDANGSAGDAAFNVMIRTLERVAGKPQARLGLGSGLVVDSIPRDEWAECRLKGEFVAKAAADFDLIETMRYDPTEGIVALEAHLARMKQAAADLGFDYDRHDARNELQAATFGKRDVSLVRLLLSKTGSMAIEVRRLDEQQLEEPVPVSIAPLPVDPGDFRLRYKTTDRAFYDEAREANGSVDTIFERPDGLLTEGTISNLFVEKDGTLVTPRAESGLVPGVLRAGLLAEGKAVEGDIRREDLEGGFFIGSSVRGLRRARLA
ncbi:aminodeoxychorismate synthase component I [Sphingomicrobium nitratireducens]|uniref:aminodeoxychorismate synthase component I n=1 Tax=Sphingomicrobium nitratireducens TaxID=2964666 RepID=UPI0030B91C72